MRVEHDGVYAVVASQGGAPKHPVWYHNLKKNPHVELQDRGTKRDYMAREATGDEKPSGGIGRSRHGPTTRRTRRRPTGKSRCSCSSQWSSRGGTRSGVLVLATHAERRQVQPERSEQMPGSSAEEAQIDRAIARDGYRIFGDIDLVGSVTLRDVGQSGESHPREERTASSAERRSRE